MALYTTTFGLVLVLLLAIPVAGIFSDEFNDRADAIFFSSQYGKTKATRNKIISGLILSSFIYWGGMTVLAVVSFGVMGVSGFNTPYQMEHSYSIYTMTMGQHYLLILSSGYIASLVSASSAMLVASKTRSTGLAMITPFALFAVSPFIGRALPFKTFYQLTPDQLINILNCARIPYIYQVGSIVFRQIPFIMMLYTAIAVLSLPLIYRGYQTHTEK